MEYAQLLTAGTNRVAGGPFTSYDFHLDILGTARPSATPVDFTAATDPRDVIAGEVEKLQDKAAKYGLTVSNVVAICGKGFSMTHWLLNVWKTLVVNCALLLTWPLWVYLP